MTILRRACGMDGRVSCTGSVPGKGLQYPGRSAFVAKSAHFSGSARMARSSTPDIRAVSLPISILSIHVWR